MTSTLRGILDELRAGLHQIYGERLKGVYVFGSYARGEAAPDSDLDLLVILDRVEDYSSEIKRTSHLIAQLSLDSGMSLSRVFIPESDWLSGQTPFILNVREEAIPA